MDIKVGKHTIGDNHPAFIIAELSANHLQKYDLAVKTIKAMKAAGADAVKISTDEPNGGITINCHNKYFKIKGGTLWDNNYLYDLYQKVKTPWEWHKPLQKLTEQLGMVFFSTPSCNKSTDFLVNLNVPILKVSSFELNDTNLVKYIASKNKPIILSTGMAYLGEIEDAVKACKSVGNDKIILLKCVSAYPSRIEDTNLNNIFTLKKIFGTIVGLSDHTLGINTAIAAVAIGAKVIEKHFILDRRLGGPDCEFSLEPEEFKSMVSSIREVEKAMGSTNYILTKSAKKGRIFARSLFTTKDIQVGEVFTINNIKSIRPNYGLSPKYLGAIIGKKARINIKKGTPLTWDLL
ncbi:MAG: pseudaminic acid synthase, partial [Ignavibacteria bacterium]|nr:pseudaminic acid synthase [Ignavibacteria bacterium]